MPQNQTKSKYLIFFFMFYAVTYMANAVYGTFIPVYLNGVGFNKSLVGILMSLGPFVAMLAQPVWGIAGDRSHTKNTILKVLLIGSAFSVVLYPVSDSFYYLFATITAFTFFQTSINPMTDAITLEHIETTKWKFGPIRMAGTIGFALMSITAGALAKGNINIIFILYFIINMAALIVAFRLPKVKGHQSEGKKVPIWILFKNKELVLLMSFNLVVQITLGFYYSFFPIYFTKELGASNGLLGWAMFISSISEVPFLLFADKILKKIGVKFTMLVGASVVALRWLLFYSVANMYAILALNVMHGLSFIVFMYSMATYIGSNVPKELRASGQAVNGVIGAGVARIIGSIAGGFLSDLVGIRQVFLFSSILDFVAVAVFGFIFLSGKKGSLNKLAEAEDH